MNKKILIGVGVFILIGMIFFVFNSSTNDTISGDVNEFNVDAFRFGYSSNVIRVSQGDNVRINVNNTDTTHGIRFPEFGVAGMDSVEFVADKKGEFIWRCNNFCGEGHGSMQGKLIVE
jgi:cytochrome c oxidase subunit 2